MTDCTIRSHKLSSSLRNASVSVQHKQNLTSNRPLTYVRGKEKIFRALLRERRHCKNALERARISKLVRKQVRFHMRQRRNAKLNEILSEFRDLGRLNVIREEGMKRQQSTSEQPSPDDCADLLARVRQTAMTHWFTHARSRLMKTWLTRAFQFFSLLNCSWPSNLTPPAFLFGAGGCRQQHPLILHHETESSK